MKTKLFNPLDYLQPSDIPDYLNDAYNDADPKVFLVALGHVIKKKGVTKVARQAGINRENLHKILKGQVEPRWGTIHRLLGVLGIQLKVH